jgi:uncharacterized protein YjiS (DUF1127 family)
MADTDPGSLDRLHDIVTPPPVSWWPPAPGWYLVGVVGLILVGVAAWAAIARWRRNRYRREALRELSRLSPTMQDLPVVAELVKRVALAAFSREQVAALTGQPWLKFLDRTGGGSRFAHGAGRLLEAGTFRPTTPALERDELVALIGDVRHWIQYHRC